MNLVKFIITRPGPRGDAFRCRVQHYLGLISADGRTEPKGESGRCLRTVHDRRRRPGCVVRLSSGDVRECW